MISARFDAKIRCVKNQLKCIDFAMGVDQEGLLLISICNKIRSSNKANDYLRMTTKGMGELLWVESLKMCMIGLNDWKWQLR
jgi:hypothetical protein